MKNLFLLIIFIILFTGCENFFQEYYYYDWEIPEEVNSKEDVFEILRRQEYRYRRDVGGDDWNYPHETYYNETEGLDCEDMAIFAAYMHHYCLQDEDVYLVGLESKIKWIDAPNHMIYRVGDTYYESTGFYKGYEFNDWHVFYDVIEEWSFEDMMNHMHQHGRSSVSSSSIQYEN